MVQKVGASVKKLLVGFVLLVVTGFSYSNDFPREAVRELHHGERLVCSAAVIAPDTALTARHCLDDDMIVDGRPVEQSISMREDVSWLDVAILTVPGLECPCIAIGERPKVGNQVIAYGFGPREDDTRTSGVSRVAFVGNLTDYMKEFEPTPLNGAEYIVTDRFVLAPGDSGGGLFAMQDGEWRVVGINSIGIFDPASCVPFFGCAAEVASGFVPAALANELLQR